jgi:pSer/pThr/pTyr-binding forkhead associated (FHA) protein
LPLLIALPVVEGSSVVIGRADECDAVLDSLRHLTMVSRRHCRITREGDGWIVHDLGSANGTSVNGSRLRSDRRARLREGDALLIGSRGVSEVVYRCDCTVRGAEREEDGVLDE